MTTIGASSAAKQVLRDQMRGDARSREWSIVRFLLLACVALMACVGATGPMIGWQLAGSLLLLLGVLTLYYGLLFRALQRGWFHPAIHYVNVAIEVSSPTLVLLLDAHYNGPEYALTGPMLAGWGGLIVLSSLRTRRWLALGAGLLAGFEYVAAYLFIAHRMPADALMTLTLPFVALRAFFLGGTGIITSIVADHLIRKAEDALHAVREQDLMGKYILHERIGSGGMAEVFRATYSPEGGFVKQVAVKRVLPAYAEDPDFVNLFRQEAELCSQLNHPNIVQVFDLARHERTYFLVMEFIDGLTLKALLNCLTRDLLPVDAVIYIGIQVSSALDYLHRRTSSAGEPMHLVHRDVNPPNILLSRTAEVKLTDFGIARAMNQVSVTLAGTVRGKVAYMAPEQLAGEKLDGRADLYALGLMLYEALTGLRLLSGDLDTERMRRRFMEPFPPPATHRPEMPQRLDALVQSLLRQRVEERISSAAELRASLEEILNGMSSVEQAQQVLAQHIQRAMAIVAQTGSLGPQDPTMASPSQALQPPADQWATEKTFRAR